jgi:hypothetical protein
VPVEAAPQVVCVLHYGKLLFNASSVASAGPEGGWPPSPPTNAFSTPEPARSFTGCSLLCILLGCIRCTGEYSILYLQAAVSTYRGAGCPPRPPPLQSPYKTTLGLQSVCFRSSPAKKLVQRTPGTNPCETAEHTPAISINQ